MTTTAMLVMVLICGVVWGGFLTLLWRAFSREGKKRAVDARREG